MGSPFWRKDYVAVLFIHKMYVNERMSSLGKNEALVRFNRREDISFSLRVWREKATCSAALEISFRFTEIPATPVELFCWTDWPMVEPGNPRSLMVSLGIDRE